MRLLTFFLLCWFCLGTTRATAQKYTLKDPKVSFEFVAKNTKGTIAGFESSSILDFEHPENATLKGSVSVATLDTNNGLRNWSLKSRKYFNAKAYPKITFESTSIQSNTDNAWVVNGLLTLKGIQKPVTITFSRKDNRLEGNFSLNTTDYDIGILRKVEDNLVKVTMAFVLAPLR